MKANPLVNGFILLVLALVWGSSYILMKRGLVTFSPLQVASLRIVFAGLVLLPFAVQAMQTIPRSSWPYVVMVAFVGSGLPSFLYPLAVQGIGSALPGVINALTPLFTLLIGALFFGIAINRYGLGGVLTGLVGALLLMLRATEGGFALNWFYMFCAILATVSYGLSTHVLKAKLSHLPALQLTAATFLLLLPFGLFSFAVSGGFSLLISGEEVVKQSLFFVMLLGVVGTALALVLFNYFIQKTSALLATTVTYLIPFVALLWGAFDGETITLYHLLGLSLILLGILLIRQGSSYNNAKSTN